MGLTFESRVTIGAPEDRVFGAMIDPASWHQWMEGLVKVEVLTELPLRPGARWRETRTQYGREASEVFEVLVMEPCRRLRVAVDGTQGTTGKGRFVFHYDLEPQAGSTHVKMSANIEMPGFWAGLFGKLMSGPIKKACEKDLHALKRWLENRD